MMNRKGFTLIELLVVLVIIGILAGVVIAVINPAQQRTKANQAVMRSNVSKACLAAVSCVNASAGGSCTAAQIQAEVSLSDGTPTGATYTYGVNTITGTMGAAGTLCTVTCTATATGTSPLAVAGAGCLIQ